MASKVSAKALAARRDRDRPVTTERIEHLRKQIQSRINHWPESRARAKAERKAALGFIDELLMTIEVYERKRYDNLMPGHIRQSMVRSIKLKLKLEDLPEPISVALSPGAV
jgi:hypothetical protein